MNREGNYILIKLRSSCTEGNGKTYVNDGFISDANIVVFRYQLCIPKLNR